MGRINLASQIIILLYSIIIHTSSSSRMISNPTPESHRRYDEHRTISFLMRDTLLNGNPRPATVQFPGDQLMFPKPLGLFPPSDGIPLTGSDPGATEPLGLSNHGFTFPTIATLQEMEIGSVTEIDEYLFRESMYGTEIAGRARGVYVTSSGDVTGRMMAMKVYFSGDRNADALRFFGVHREDLLESHVAVIGGTGKYRGANGYATIKSSVGVGGGSKEGSNIAYLLFNVYVS